VTNPGSFTKIFFEGPGGASLAAPVGQDPHDPTALSRHPAEESYCSAQAPDANSMESR